MTDTSWPGEEWPGTEQEKAPVQATDSGDSWPGEEWPGTEQSQRPTPESPLKTGVRAAASGVIPGLGGLAGAGAGAEIGAGLGAPLGPVGVAVGGVLGAVGGAFLGAGAAGKVQDVGKEALGLDDSTQQAVNAEANPKSAIAGDLAGNMVGFNPAKAASLGARALGAGVMGGIETGRQAVSNEDWDPTKIAMNVAAGAIAPNTNRLGAAVEGAGRGAARKFVPGRPNVEPRPEDDQAHADAGQGQTPSVARGGVTEQSPVRSTETTGNPQSAPTRSNRVYGKAKKFLGGEDTLTTGDMDPATEAALAPEESWLNTSGPRVPRSGPENPGEQLPIQTGIAETAQPQAAIQPAERTTPAPQTLEPPVETGLVQAARANANKPLPTLTRPKAAQDAIEASKAIHPKTAAVSEAAQVADREPSPAQIEAGNQKKGHERFAGKPISIENAAGSIRKSKPGLEPAWEVEMPYHYGDIKGTRGADKDPIDIAFDPQGGENHYVVDQKNAETGKFDEHKVFAHTTTPERVGELYNAGFSDARGPERLGAITKASEDELKAWFANPARKTKPYSKTFEEGIQRPVAEEASEVAAETSPQPDNQGTKTSPQPEEPYKLPPVQGAVPITPKVVTAMVKRLRDSGNPEFAKRADEIEAMSGKEQAMAATRADVVLKTGKIPTDLKIARLRPTKENLKAKIGDEVVEARSKADLARKVDAYQGLKEAYAKHAPAENETLEATRARAEALVADATKHLLAYRPNVKPAEYMLARSAKQLAAKKISVDRFIADEKLLRSGDKDMINQVRQGNRIEADIGRSQRPTVEQAEAGRAEGAAQAEPDDAPHEKAAFENVKTKADLPTETGKALDVTKPEDHAEVAAALDVEAAPKENWKDVVAKQKEEAAAKLQRQREARLAAGPKPEVKTPEWIKAHAKEVAAEAKTEAEKKDSRSNLTNVDLVKKGRVKDLWDKFIEDEVGGGFAGAEGSDIAEDLKGYFNKTQAKSYIARDAKTPSEEYARSLSDDLHKLRQADVEHSHELLRWMKSLPDDLFKKSGGSSPIERMYFAREDNSIGKLDPKEQADYNRLVRPMLDENDKLFENINKIAPERLGPDVSNHIYRITKGATPEYNILKPGESADPVAGVNGISVASKGPALARRFVALENDATGQRHVISLNKDGFTIMKDGKGQRVKDPNFAFEEGGKYQVGNDSFTMKQAMTPEIEDNARFENGKRVKYYHNAALSAGLANRYLGNMARHLQFLEDLKGNDTFKQFATPSAKEAPENWIETKLPNFKGWKMDPQLSHVMNDYAQPGFNESGLNSLRKLSQAITKTIFWLPTAHINNVGAHWFVERGWDWIKPMEYRHLVVDGMKAIKSVVSQDEYQTKLRNAGAGTIYGGVATQRFMDQFAKGVGEAIEKNPSKWDPIARQFGIGPSDLAKAIYKASSHVMWAANDMFLTEAVMRGERKGLSISQAVTEAERHIPNYRVPATVMGSGNGARRFSQLMQDPLFMAFGRYHYGVFNSYANMAKDLVKGNGADKLQAVGNLMAVGILALAVYPVLDKAARMLTGNKDASQQRRGPLAIPAHLNAARKGEEDFASAARSTFTLPPMLTTAIQAIGGKDFRGKNIIEPGDLRNADKGSLPAAAKVAGQGVDFLARGLVSPYSTLSNMLHKKESPGEGLRDQALDQKNPSAAARKYLANVPKRSQQEAVSRFKKPVGAIEGLVNKAVGFK